MATVLSPDVLVYVCNNCKPAGMRLPRQWTQDDTRVVLHEVPCSGKIDGQYLMHALEGGARGFCVVTCPKGDCHLAQGNYRAEIRIHTIRRLLGELGMEPERAELLHFSPEGSPEQLDQEIRAVVGRLCALSESPIRAQ